MKTSVLHINDSFGIVLRQLLSEHYQIRDKVQLVFKRDCIIIQPVRKPRQGWEQAFALMHQRGEDKLLINDIFTEENLD
jgi:antitoxin MazE